MPFEPRSEAAHRGRGKRLLERVWLVDVEIVWDEHDFLAVGKCLSDRSFSTRA